MPLGGFLFSSQSENWLRPPNWLKCMEAHIPFCHRALPFSSYLKCVSLFPFTLGVVPSIVSLFKALLSSSISVCASAFNTFKGFCSGLRTSLVGRQWKRRNDFPFPVSNRSHCKIFFHVVGSFLGSGITAELGPDQDSHNWGLSGAMPFSFFSIIGKLWMAAPCYARICALLGCIQKVIATATNKAK